MIENSPIGMQLKVRGNYSVPLCLVATLSAFYEAGSLAIQPKAHALARKRSPWLPVTLGAE